MTIARFLAKALAVTLAVAGLQLGLAVPVGATEEVVLPPPIPEEYLEDDCSGQVAVMVAWDEQAWVSDVGMAIAILDNIGSTCLILAGPRDGLYLPRDMFWRFLDADNMFCVVGGPAAVSPYKAWEHVEHFEGIRVGGVDSADTANLVTQEISREGDGMCQPPPIDYTIPEPPPPPPPPPPEDPWC